MFTLMKRIFALIFCCSTLSMYAEEAAGAKSDVKEEVLFEIKANQEEGRIIEEIVTTISKNNLLALGFKRGHLKALGQRLRHLGSLQFLGYIFSHDSLKMHMSSIRRSSAKWGGFVDGMVPGLNRDANADALNAILPSFAKFLNINADTLMQTAKKREWHAFVEYIQSATSQGRRTAIAQEEIPKDQVISAQQAPQEIDISAPSE